MSDKPTITEILPLVKAYKERWGTALHIVLDDGNVSDADIQYCLDRSREDVQLAEALLKMSKTQRRKLSRMRYD